MLTDEDIAEAYEDGYRRGLEDAAKKVESLWAYRTCAEVAAAIRALDAKEQSNE